MHKLICLSVSVSFSHTHPSLLRYGDNYGSNEFYATGPSSYVSLSLSLTHTLAYYSTEIITVVMSFMLQAQAHAHRQKLARIMIIVRHDI